MAAKKRVFAKIERFSILNSLKINSAALCETIRQLQAEKDTLCFTLKSIAELYPRDLSCPGMVLAYLPEQSLYYASLVRYKGGKGEGKQVLFSAKEETLEGVIVEVVSGWVKNTAATQTLQKRARERILNEGIKNTVNFGGHSVKMPD